MLRLRRWLRVPATPNSTAPAAAATEPTLAATITALAPDATVAPVATLATRSTDAASAATRFALLGHAGRRLQPPHLRVHLQLVWLG